MLSPHDQDEVLGMFLRVLTHCVMVCGVLFATRSSSAAPAARETPRILVFESHIGGRSPEIARLMEPLDDELEAHGFAARPQTMLKLAGGAAPRPGILDKSQGAADVAQKVDAGYRLFTQGKAAEAKEKLAEAIETMRRNPATFALDTSNTDVAFRAQVTLSLSYKQLGDAANSVAAMTELIRMFPARPLPRNAYGPGDEGFYRDVLKQVQAMGRGRLAVTAGDTRAVIFVDGQIRGVGSATIGDLVPGLYRVFIQVPQTIGRQYEVTVGANDESKLDVHYDIDDVLWLSDSWVGFQFQNEGDRGREGKLAAELASRWSPGAGKTAVIGTVQLQGKPALVGTLYANDGSVVFSAAVSVAGASEVRLRALARFLADGTPADGLQIVKGNAEPAEAHESAEPNSNWHTSSKVIGGTSVLLMAGSMVAYFASPADDHSKPTYNNHRTPAVVAFCASSYVAGAGVYLWLRDSHSVDPLAASLIGVGIGSILSGAMLFATKEDAEPGFQRETYRHTGTTGLIVGGVGVALAGVGIYIMNSERAYPTVSIVNGSGVAGIAGSF